MEWRPIPQHPGFDVSEYGDVRDNIGRWRRFNMNANGYMVVDVGNNSCRRQWLVNRLVCIVFHGEPPFAAAQAAHGDGCRINNHYSNLRWATALENADDRRRHGTIVYGRIPNWAKLSHADAGVIRARVARGEKQNVIAREYGVSPATIHKVVTGKTRFLPTGTNPAPITKASPSRARTSRRGVTASAAFSNTGDGPVHTIGE